MPAATTEFITITYYQEPHPNQRELKLQGKPHRPFWFATSVIDGVEKHLYLGHQFRPVQLSEFGQTGAPNDFAHQAYQESAREEVHEDSQPESATHATAEPEPTSASEPYSSATVNPVNSQREAKTSTVNAHWVEKVGKRKELQKHEKNVETNAKHGPIHEVRLPTEREFLNDLRQFKTMRFKDVRARYRQLIKKYHPDQFGQYLEHEQVQEWMRIINGVHESHMRRMQRLGIR